MSRTVLRQLSPVALAVATALGLAVGRAADTDSPPPPDTSNWKCEQCPFLQGYNASIEAGAEYADGANASYGRYTGVDHNGVYAAAAATGKWRDRSGTFASYQVDDLGLPSREVYLDTGREGLFDVRVGYDGQPARLYDTTRTPYRSAASGQLTLPNNWIAGGTTAAMSQLEASLAPVKIEYDRRTVSLLGQFFASRDWTVYADLNHQEKTGTGVTSGSFLTDAAQLPMPINYVTNSVETGVRWTGRMASLRLAYAGSWFKDATDSLTWQNPYLPIVAGSTQGRLALPPGNNLQQAQIGGDVRLPIFMATLTYEASYGKLTQDQAFLSPGTLPGTGRLAQGSLGGDVHISHYGMALSTQPLQGLYLRGKASYDGRDDHTRALTVPYVVTDTFSGGTYVTPRYGEDRARLEGSADYRVLRWLRVGAAGEALHIHYSPGQVVTSTDNNRGWGHVTVNPLASLTLTAKAGNARRKSGVFNITALPVNENPLLRAYNYAPRDQNFFSLSGSWSVTSSLTWALEASWADDAYRLSSLGLQNGRDRRLASTLTWA
ncbi:MAG TPA: MtrB/PioB family decaheme-associated outer membrane protein, partial [Steroidobacteraceae bacterium]